jgi:predicted DNA binding CopG/RHH family protein
MAINQELLNQIEASADDWGPSGKYGNDEKFVSAGVEDDKLDERLGLDPISIRFPKELVRDLKAIAQLNGMRYQPLIREVCKRFVASEKRALRADMARRRQEELEVQRKLVEEQKRLDDEATLALKAEEAAFAEQKAA